MTFIDGISVDFIVGFTELGNTDEFKTIDLARRLINGNAMTAKSNAEKGRMKIKKKKGGQSSGSEEEY